MDASDDGLWLRSRDGDGDAFAELYDRHRDRVFRHALRLVTNRHDAEDVLAAAFLELWRRRDDVRVVGGSVLPWLLVTASNVARNTARGTRRYRALLARLPRTTDAADAADLAFADDVAAVVDPALGAALRSLDRRDLHLVTLVALEGLPLAEAAELLHLTPAAAKSRLHRTRARLRDQLAPAPRPAVALEGR